MKDGDAALVESLVRLKREKFVPERDLIFAFTADEEAGGDSNGPRFLLKEHRELIDAALESISTAAAAIPRTAGASSSRSAPAKRPTSPLRWRPPAPEDTAPSPAPTTPSIDWRPASAACKAFKFPVMLTATTRASFDSWRALESGALGGGHARGRASRRPTWPRPSV